MQPFERIKCLRKEKLNKTQEEFSKEIGISRGNLASIEIGRVNLTDRNINIICDKFGVNEAWLRDGIGPVFRKKTIDAEIAGYIGSVMKKEDNDFQKRLILALSKLDDTGWDVLEELVDNIKKDQGT